MLGNAAPTQFDLRFSLFGIPVRVHPTFWLLGAAWGWNPQNINYMFLFMACFFVSILIHELGHALTALYFGWAPEIVLYALGGYAAYQPTWGYTTSRSVAVTIAGPAAGFSLYFIVAGIEYFLLQGELELSNYYMFVIRKLKYMNLWWSVFNLLPVYPLDGGQISRKLLMHFRPRDGLEISLKISLLVGGGLAAYFFKNHDTFVAIFLAMLAVESFQHLQGMRYR